MNQAICAAKKNQMNKKKKRKEKKFRKLIINSKIYCLMNKKK